MQKLILKISGMHCSSCSLRIDGDLEEIEGVVTANTNFAKGQTEVQYEESKVATDRLVEVIKKAGYTVVA